MAEVLNCVKEGATMRLAFLVALAAALGGCAVGSSKVVADRSELRSRSGGLIPQIGVCTGSRPSAFDGDIKSCLQQGSPGTLHDDETIRLVSTVHGHANSHDADTGEWQLEIFRDGKPLHKGMMQRTWPPELDCTLHPCHSWSVDVRKMEELPAGTYVFRYTFGLDTSKVVTNTIVIKEGRP